METIIYVANLFKALFTKKNGNKSRILYFSFEKFFYVLWTQNYVKVNKNQNIIKTLPRSLNLVRKCSSKNISTQTPTHTTF